MTTKLNLTIEEATAKKIKAYAEKKKTSVSRIAEEYFKQLTAEKNGKKKKSFVDEWAGFLPGSIPDIDKAKDDYLKKKYGL